MEVQRQTVELESARKVEAQPGTAAEKIAATLRAISEPGEDAEGLELGLASLAMALESGISGELEQRQQTGELDAFVLALTRFLALHRSADARQLVVVELPTRELPPLTRLHLLDEAIEASRTATAPF